MASWTDTDTYDAGVAGTYTFTAVLGTLPSGYTNTDALTATVNVVVGAELKNITSFDAISNVDGGTVGAATYADAAAAEAALPSNVTAEPDSASVPVASWTDTDTYNAGVAGTYTFTAVLGTLPSGYTNTDALTATVQCRRTCGKPSTAFLKHGSHSKFIAGRGNGR